MNILLKSFILKAKASIYNGLSHSSTLGTKEILFYTNGSTLTYTLEFTKVHSSEMGTELVTKGDMPAWASTYVARFTEDIACINVLQNALRIGNKTGDFRGPPAGYKEGDYEYSCEYWESYNLNSGSEIITYRDKIVYERHFNEVTF